MALAALAAPAWTGGGGRTAQKRLDPQGRFLGIPPGIPEGWPLPPYGAGFTSLLLSRATAPIRASALPFSAAPVLSVMA